MTFPLYQPLHLQPAGNLPSPSPSTHTSPQPGNRTWLCPQIHRVCSGTICLLSWAAQSVTSPKDESLPDTNQALCSIQREASTGKALKDNSVKRKLHQMHSKGLSQQLPQEPRACVTENKQKVTLIRRKIIFKKSETRDYEFANEWPKGWWQLPISSRRLFQYNTFQDTFILK